MDQQHDHDDHHHPHHGHDEHGHHVTFDDPAVAAKTELEGEALIGAVEAGAATVAEIAGREHVTVGRILDLGSGPGVGAGVLAERFPSATVVAADGSPAMLARAAARFERLGLADRVATRQVDLPDGIDDLDPADVVWASMVLHHVGDEVAALGRMRRLLAPGGLLALVEGGTPVRVVPDDVDLGRPGLWDRMDAAWHEWFRAMREELPGSVPSGDHATMLDRAGYEVLAEVPLVVDVGPPLDDAGRQFARRQLAGARGRLEGHADPADLDALDRLLDDDADTGILRRTDAVVRTTRQLYVARSLVDPAGGARA